MDFSGKEEIAVPFTFAHPAAVVPFIKRQNMNATALVLGSMAPDFEYFVRFQPVGLFGHNLGGFLYFNLPLCFLIFYTFHKVVKKPFIACLPHPFDDWFWNFAVREWNLNSIRSVWIFTYSALLGMVTHVLWDSFTHQTGWFVERSPILFHVVHLSGIAIPIFKILQHGSTIGGLVMLAFFCYRLRDQQTRVPQILASGTKGSYYGSIVIFGGTACLGLFLWHSYIDPGYSPIGAYIVTFLNGLVLGTIAASIFLKKSFKWQN